MSGVKGYRIARQNTVHTTLKSNLRRRRNSLRPVIDFRYLLEGKGKVFGGNLACRLYLRLQSNLGICRMSRYAVIIGECIVLSHIVYNRNLVADVLLDDIAAAVTRDILVRIVPLYGHLCVVIHRIAVRPAHELVRIRRSCRIANVRLVIILYEDIMMQFLPVDRTVHECITAVIDLVYPCRLRKADIDRTPCDLTVARCREIAVFKIFPVEFIVPQGLRIARCSDVICNLPCIGDIFRLHHAVVLGKVCPLRTVNGKGDHVAGDNLARIRLKGTSRRDSVFAGAVVDLRRLAAADLERCAVNLLTGDCPLAVNGLIDLVVVLHRAELIVKRSLHLLVPNIVLGAVARVHILGKGSTRTAPVAAEGRITGQLSPILRL